MNDERKIEGLTAADMAREARRGAEQLAQVGNGPAPLLINTVQAADMGILEDLYRKGQQERQKVVLVVPPSVGKSTNLEAEVMARLAKERLDLDVQFVETTQEAARVVAQQGGHQPITVDSLDAAMADQRPDGSPERPFVIKAPPPTVNDVLPVISKSPPGNWNPPGNLNHRRGR